MLCYLKQNYSDVVPFIVCIARSQRTKEMQSKWTNMKHFKLKSNWMLIYRTVHVMTWLIGMSSFLDYRGIFFRKCLTNNRCHMLNSVRLSRQQRRTVRLDFSSFTFTSVIIYSATHLWWSILNNASHHSKHPKLINVIYKM